MKPHLDILMVDDDEVDLGLFRQAIARTGLNIGFQPLTTGRDAIDYLEAKGYYQQRATHPLPDVIVLDLKMPNINGLDFLAWRKASDHFSAIPVAALSGSTDKREIERALELGATIHLVKPDTFEGWQKIVREIWSVADKAETLSVTQPTPDAAAQRPAPPA